MTQRRGSNPTCHWFNIRPRGALGLLVLCLATLHLSASADPIPVPIGKGTVLVRLDALATGLTAPVWGNHAPGDDRHLFVADQDGTLWRIDIATGERFVFLDLSDRLVALGVSGPGSFDERGFLGFAFHPQYRINGLLYTYTSEPAQAPADFDTLPAGLSANHQSVISEWRVTDPSLPAALVDPSSARELLRIDQPQFNHNAGAIEFGPDGQLYIALGDGGGADDPDGAGQDPGNPLGTLLRIDPLGLNANNGNYAVPADNPFLGDPSALAEAFAYGFRNPYRFSFDRVTGELWLADVGQHEIEEVNRVSAGGNYGWNRKEGSFLFDPNGSERGFVTDRIEVPGLIDPVAEYDHDEGSAIIGGFVHRGTDMPSLLGLYLFGDSFHAPSGGGRLFYLEDGTIRELLMEDRDRLGLVLLGFGEDASGALYVLANETGTPFGDTGVVLRVSQPLFYSVASGELAIPRIRVASAKGERFYSALLQRVSAAEPLTFELTHAEAIAGPTSTDAPFGDAASGIYSLPRVQVIFGPTDIRAYSATLRRVPGTAPLRVEVVETSASNP